MRSVAAAVAFVALAGAALAGEPAADRRAELLYMLKHDCGSCHGMSMKGGLGAPLLPSAMADRDSADLAAVILDGVPGTPMPPWRALLSPDDAVWLANAIKDGKGMP